MGYLQDALSLDGTVGIKEQKKRKILLACCSIGSVFSLVRFMSTPQWRVSGSVRLGVVAYLLVALPLFSVVISILCKKRLTTTGAVAMVYTMVCGALLWDLDVRTVKETSWPVLVLAVDLLLVMQVPARYSVGLACVSILWLIVLALEESFRFGLLDIPGTQLQEERRRRLTLLTACDTLPCAVDFPPYSLSIGLGVFVVDFLATRGFARDVLKEQAAMQHTINTVQDIASLLAGYDVEGVTRMLEAQETLLPEEMHATLQTLEQNLRKYRPYLPAALFEEDEEDGVQHTSVAPPGLESGTATIVFTDIRASTSIWECTPDGMRGGLKIHNRVMREVMQVFGGYEVKTIGDAFMIAFETTADGMRFALQVQEKLLEADWPASLLEDAPICTPQDSLWGGLTVRIGVNTGPVTVEHNTLTGRTDYFGHTVNVASRLESTCKPGAVAVLSDLWTSDCGAFDAVVGQLEALYLKGVSGATFVCPVWPVSLVGRRQQPLCEADNRKSLIAVSDSVSVDTARFSTNGSVSSVATRHILGTVGVADLAVGDEEHFSALQSMSSGLSTLTVALDQSGGSLVTLLGSRVCVSWNVTRSAPAHMENAIHFAQRMSGATSGAGVGLASGSVQHGDVGARKQRFVTVMGSTVRRSWTLCEEAVREGVVCLFEPPEGTTLPTALEHVLSERTMCPGVYNLVNCTIRGSVF